jgi:hypothetical protein
MTTPSTLEQALAKTNAKYSATVDRDDVLPASKAAAIDWLAECRKAALAGDYVRLDSLGKSVRWEMREGGLWDFVTDKPWRRN